MTWRIGWRAALQCSWLVVAGVAAVSAPGCRGAQSGEAEGVGLPAPDAWIDHGPVVTAGEPGAWDARLFGMITPATVVRRAGTYYLYYLGASGDRADGGPAHRKLGVATSDDGLIFTKYEGNPIIEYAEGLPECDECGVFSAGAVLTAGDTVVLYFGGMREETRGSVSGDGILAVSADGLHFELRGVVIDHDDPTTIGDDELFPVGAFQTGGETYVYYIAKGGGHRWDLALASGPDLRRFKTHRVVMDLRQDVIGMGDPLWVMPDRVVVPVLTSFRRRQIRLRTSQKGDFGVLDIELQRLRLEDVTQGTIFYDAASRTLFLYYLPRSHEAIGVMTAAWFPEQMSTHGFD